VDVPNEPKNFHPTESYSIYREEDGEWEVSD
jgi:hypothetical protein